MLNYISNTYILLTSTCCVKTVIKEIKLSHVVLYNIKSTNVTDFPIMSQSLKLYLITLHLRLMENISYLIFFAYTLETK